ncbi:MAG: barstar family protein [Terriglobales bacterium]
MRELVLDASEWRTKDDVYDAFFAAVGAPKWHGRNLDALNDSIGTGQINGIEVPYRVVITHYGKISGSALRMTDLLVELLQELGARGVPVEVRVE